MHGVAAGSDDITMFSCVSVYSYRFLVGKYKAFRVYPERRTEI